MTLNIVRTGDADHPKFIRALICGEAGAGKTLISSTFPNPLYLTTEGLMMSVADRNVAYHKVKTYEEIRMVKQLLDQSPKDRAKEFGFPVDTLVIDTIDDVSRMMLRERMRQQKHDTAELSDYGWLKEQLGFMVTALRNLDVNLVLTCHLKTREVAGQTAMIPAIEGGFSGEVQQHVDLALVLRTRLVTRVVGHDTVRDVERYLQTIQDPAHTWIKDHSGKLPQEFPVNFDDDYERLLAIAYPIDDAPTATAKKKKAAVTAEETEVPQDAAATDGPPFECQNCHENFDDEDAKERSQIKFSRVYCPPCFDRRSEKQTA